MAMTSLTAELGKKAVPFTLLGVDGKQYSLADCSAEKGLLVMFICNHCPYVKAILPRLVEDVKVLQQAGIGCVAICSNDAAEYPEDSYENMQKLAQAAGFTFPYLLDESQEIARAYGAICTPDFFGYNSNLLLQYRGRLDESGKNPAPPGAKRELVVAMQLISTTGSGPKEQIPSMGCSIKWRTLNN